MGESRSVNDEFEAIRGAVPGARTAALRPGLTQYESQNVTYVGDEFPVFWESASGSTITDVDGNRYIDLTSAFGVASVGHANPAVVSAISEQAARLMHGMGDVHPTEVRTRLLERLARLLPQGLTKTFLATTGSEAVEAAIKTASLATGKHRFLAYRGAYHGLSLGTLTVSGIEKFIEPFSALVPHVTRFLDYPDAQRISLDAAVDALYDQTGACDEVAAIIIEPLQGRGGNILPPKGYLAAVRQFCNDCGILMIVDEIYTGFGRTGYWKACEAEGVVPDIICIGKAMGGGFPISAAVAKPRVMDVWPKSTGEALHTSTYLGNPMGCAAALATIEEIERKQLIKRARDLGELLGTRLERLRSSDSVVAVRGRGMMWGVQLRSAAESDRLVKRVLARGVIALQAGPTGDVVSITPPLVISEPVLIRALDIIKEEL
jgi:4-aminobutyrate aminotransferase-like enzyme